MFPQESSNKPPFTNVFQSMEGSHFSEKEIHLKLTVIYWVKNSYIKKLQPNFMEPNSITQMRNQVLSDGYPQKPSLIHNTQSQEFQIDRVKAQIEKLQRLGKNEQANELMAKYFSNQVMIGEMSQMVKEIKDLRADILKRGFGGSIRGSFGPFGSDGLIFYIGNVLNVFDIELSVLEENFDELISKRPEEIVNDMKYTRKLIKTK